MRRSWLDRRPSFGYRLPMAGSLSGATGTKTAKQERRPKCTRCRNRYFPELDRCPHCGAGGPCPNVFAAEDPAEKRALDDRYRRAVAAAQSCADAVRELEKRLDKSVAVRRVPAADLITLASGDDRAAATYWGQLRGGMRLPGDDEWSKLRGIVDQVMFGSYREKIHFAALTLDGRALDTYGDATLEFRTEMIADRATVFEDNSALLMKRMGQTYDVPVGFRATWPRRGKLGVAKLATALHDGPIDVAALVLQAGATTADDTFIEVHIYERFTLHTVRRIAVSEKHLSELQRERLSLRAKALSIELVFDE